jgi:hypothetical protein
LLWVRLVVERGRHHQPGCCDDCEQRYASCRRKTGRSHHKQDACVTDLRLVQERVALDDHERDNRRPEAEANEPGAHAMRH